MSTRHDSITRCVCYLDKVLTGLELQLVECANRMTLRKIACLNSTRGMLLLHVTRARDQRRTRTDTSPHQIR